MGQSLVKEVYMTHKESSNRERGAALVEFALVATTLFTVLFGVIEFGRLLWTHNALKDAARRGTRYAVVRRNDSTSIQAVKNMVVYGDPNANPVTAKPVVPGLATSNVSVEHQNFGGVLLSSRATVSINNYKFKFLVPIIGTTINLPNYRTSLPGESAGYVPCDTSSAPTLAPCNIVPN
jgi:Flp pilus assembly protein TadG